MRCDGLRTYDCNASLSSWPRIRSFPCRPSNPACFGVYIGFSTFFLSAFDSPLETAAADAAFGGRWVE